MRNDGVIEIVVSPRDSIYVSAASDGGVYLRMVCGTRALELEFPSAVLQQLREAIDEQSGES